MVSKTLLESLKQDLLRALVILGFLRRNEPTTPVEPTKSLTPPTPAIAPIPVPQVNKTSLETFCNAIKDYEGFAPNTRSFRNNNPGNCRYSSVGYAPYYGTVKRDSSGFAVFSTYDLGWHYLLNLVHIKITTHPDWNFYDFFNVYAPSTDNNNPQKYAIFVATRVGVGPSEVLSKIIT